MTDNYRIFISSSMNEFREVRPLIKNRLDRFFSTFVYELDAGASNQNIQTTFINELSKCDLYIGLFGTKYGKYTIDEFNEARLRDIPCHIYVKNLQDLGSRDEKLTKFIESISIVEAEQGLTSRWFFGNEDLIKKIEIDIGRWIKYRDKKNSKQKLNDNIKFYCNRETQSDDFIMNVKKDKFNFFIIDGVKKQSHFNLVRRFSLDTIARDNVKVPIQISDKGNLERFKLFIKKKLFDRFDVKPYPRDFSLSTLSQKILHNNYGKVFVVFRVEEDLMTNTLVSEGIKWFASEYCKKDELPLDAPDFYFFLMIRYNEGKRSKKRAIEKRLNKLKNYIKLDELENVTTKDIKIWLEENRIAETEISRENIIGNYFEEKSFPMEIAENQISKLIFDFNNNDQKLISLIRNF